MICRETTPLQNAFCSMKFFLQLDIAITFVYEHGQFLPCISINQFFGSHWME